MSTKDGKVRFSFRKRRNALVVGSLIAVQFVLTLVLSVSLAAHIIWPEGAKGATAAPVQISYEGRLTDSSGNALGGTGSPYCYRFSLYDAATAGNKLWPPGTPSVTTATTTDGVFAAIIGQADTLSSTVFDFSTTSSAYLQVDVSTSSPTCASNVESLTPRQQILSSAYAMTANNLGSQLRSDKDNGRIQTGSGAGAATPVYFGLDWKNTADYVGQTCSTNGLMWYNSSQSQALVCEGGFIQRVGNSTTTVAAIGDGSSTSTGAVYLADANGVSFGMNGNTVTASVNAGGGGTLSFYQNMPYLPMSSASAFGQTTSIIVPFLLAYNVSASYIRMPVTMSAISTAVATVGNTSYSASVNSTLVAVIYSLGVGANSRSLQSVASGSAGVTQRYSFSAAANSTQYTVGQSITYPSQGFNTATIQTSYGSSTSNIQVNSTALSNLTGIRYLDIPFNNSLPPGQYFLAFGQSTSVATNVAAATVLTAARLAMSNWVVTQPNNTYLQLGNASATNSQGTLFGGYFTTAGGVLSTASLNLSNISSTGSHPTLYFQMIRMS